MLQILCLVLVFILLPVANVFAAADPFGVYEVTLEDSNKENIVFSEVDGTIKTLLEEGILDCTRTDTHTLSCFGGQYVFSFSSDFETLSLNVQSETITGTRRAGTFFWTQGNGNATYSSFGYIPDSVPTTGETDIVMCQTGSDMTNDSDYEHMQATTLQFLLDHAALAENGGVAVMASANPRYSTSSPSYEPVHLDRSSLLNLEGGQRPDEIVINNIDAFKQNISDSGRTPADKVMILGHSSGGAFARRFTMLQPDRVKKVANVSGAGFTWPLSASGNETLNWPVGIADLQTLTGSSFQINAFRQVSFFISVGEQEVENGEQVCRNEPCYTDEQVLQVSAFGDNVEDLHQSVHETYQSLGVDSTFRKETGKDHDYDESRAQTAFSFLLSSDDVAQTGNIVLLLE